MCGRDEKTWRDFTHRKLWIRERLELLAGLFGIDVLGCSVMSNHLHVLIGNCPEITSRYGSDAQSQPET